MARDLRIEERAASIASSFAYPCMAADATRIKPATPENRRQHGVLGSLSW